MAPDPGTAGGPLNAHFCSLSGGSLRLCLSWFCFGIVSSLTIFRQLPEAEESPLFPLLDYLILLYLKMCVHKVHVDR